MLSMLLTALLAFAATPVGAFRGTEIDLEHLAAPWVSPESTKLPYMGLHNRLRALLDVQAEQRRVSITFFTVAQQPMLLNCVYSLVKYGKARNYVVVAIDHESLTRCITLRLPCYNATHILGNFASSRDYRFGSEQYRRLVHSKPSVVWEIFRLGLTIHFTDVDVTYLRNVWASYDRFLALRGADAAFMNEYLHLNSGNFVIRQNERTQRMVQAWASDPPERMTYLTDQEWLISLNGRAFKLCTDRGSCQHAKDSGLAALALHPSQFGKVSWTGHCAGRRPWPACAPYTLYLHAICYSGQDQKMDWMKYYDLWHLAEDDYTPMQRQQQHPFLPCAEPVAWRQGGSGKEGSAEASVVYPKIVFDAQDDEDVKHLKPPQQ